MSTGIIPERISAATANANPWPGARGIGSNIEILLPSKHAKPTASNQKHAASEKLTNLISWLVSINIDELSGNISNYFHRSSFGFQESVFATCKVNVGADYIQWMEHRLTQDGFDELAAKWKRDTNGVSSMSRTLSNESYQKILTYGWQAVPFIIADLKKEAAPWFSALRLITGQCGIGVNHRGQFRKIADEWIQWWQDSNRLEALN